MGGPAATPKPVPVAAPAAADFDFDSAMRHAEALRTEPGKAAATAPAPDTFKNILAACRRKASELYRELLHSLAGKHGYVEHL